MGGGDDDAKQLVAAYEQLRMEALGVAGELHRSLGMVVLLRDGMSCWMKAIRESNHHAPRMHWSPTASSPPIALSVQGEATRILVNMAMRRTAHG